VYAVGVTALGVWMLMSSVKVWHSHTVADARALLKVSVIYLPLFFALLLCDSSL
jgi:heme O synthase-like polyprenyltransferase